MHPTNLSSRLPYMFAVSRFAHYYEVHGTRSKLIDQKKDQLTLVLQEWINEYVDGDPTNSASRPKPARLSPLHRSTSSPMKRTRSTTQQNSSCARIQLEGMDIGLSLVSRMPEFKQKDLRYVVRATIFRSLQD